MPKPIQVVNFINKLTRNANLQNMLQTKHWHIDLIMDKQQLQNLHQGVMNAKGKPLGTQQHSFWLMGFP
jgi:hypothetical protein